MPLDLVTIPCRRRQLWPIFCTIPANIRERRLSTPGGPPPEKKGGRPDRRRPCRDRGWALSDILLTHHHERTLVGGSRAGVDGARVYRCGRRCPTGCRRSILAVGRGRRPDDPAANRSRCSNVSGHTLGHLGPSTFRKAAMPSTGRQPDGRLGCGWLFEGRRRSCWDSPEETAQPCPPTR